MSRSASRGRSTRRTYKNSDKIAVIDEWLSDIRVQLKKQVIEKQTMEVENFNLYSYMHSIFGAEVLEIFDIHYDPEKQHPIRTMEIDSRAGTLDQKQIRK